MWFEPLCSTRSSDVSAPDTYPTIMLPPQAVDRSSGLWDKPNLREGQAEPFNWVSTRAKTDTLTAMSCVRRDYTQNP